MSVLVVGAVGASIAVAVILLGLGSSRTSMDVLRSGEARELASACAEEALLFVRDSMSPPASGGLTLGNGTCEYAITDQGDQNFVVDASGVVGTVIRKVKVIAMESDSMVSVDSWQEVDDF